MLINKLLMPLKKDKLKRNDTHEIKILEIIWELVDMLVKRIKKDKKYENVIIYSYHNKTTDTGIGHVNYYGTMMRYMSFYNENIKYAIIRNCRTPIAPLDVLIQKEWIKSGKDYLFMISNNYNFNSEKNEYEQNFIKNEKKNMKFPENSLFKEDIENNNYIRFFAALASYNLAIVRNGLIERIKYFDEEILKTTKYKDYIYGIDEISLIWILPYSIFTTYNTKIYYLNMNDNNSILQLIKKNLDKHFKNKSVFDAKKFINRFQKASLLAFSVMNINFEHDMLKCNNIHLYQMVCSMDEIKPLGFAFYYSKNQQLYKYNFKEIDIVNYTEQKNLKWLSIGIDAYVQHYEWYQNYDKIDAKKFGKTLPNDELNWFVSKKDYKPLDMKLAKLFFVDVSEKSNSHIIALELFDSIVNNIVRKPLLISFDDIGKEYIDTSKQSKSYTKKSSKKNGDTSEDFCVKTPRKQIIKSKKKTIR